MTLRRNIAKRRTFRRIIANVKSTLNAIVLDQAKTSIKRWAIALGLAPSTWDGFAFCEFGHGNDQQATSWPAH